MTPETPEPEAPRSGAPRPDGDQSLPPRVLVSVGDLEDPAEWDVILVENQEIDDETARRIAAQRAGRPTPPGRKRRGPRAPAGPTVSLPSLDERDVIQAFEEDRDAEDATGLGDEAFARPDDLTPVRRRPSTDLPPTHDAFDGIPEPGDPEPEPEPEPAPTDEEMAFPFATAAPEVEDSDEADVDVLEEEEAELTEPWLPAHREGPALIDDPDDSFYAIQDDEDPATDESQEEADDDSAAIEDSDETETETEADPSVDEPVEIETDDTGSDTETQAEADEDPIDEWDPTAGALDDERELLDDPDSSFYELGRTAGPRTTTPPLIAPAAGIVAPPPPIPSLPAPTARLSSDLWGKGADLDVPSADDVFEDEVEIDSTFPLGPDDLAVDGEVQPVALDELDYANVFGPVTGSLAVPDLDAPVATRRPIRPTYEDDLYVFEEDEDGQWPVPPPRSSGRRRELVALGLAAGVLVALGVGSQVFARSGGEPTATVETTTSTTQLRARTSDVTAAPDLTLPTTPPADDGAKAPVGGGKVTTTTVRKGSSTTVKGNTTTTAAPTTTTAAPTTTTEPPVTTTTEPPSTTTTLE